MFVVTEDWIESNCTKAGGWNKIQLVQLGVVWPPNVVWPPKSDWKKAAVGCVISDKEKNIFEAWGACSPNEVVTDTPQEKILDIFEFDDLIDAYQTAQNEGTTKDRVDARRALKDAYRAALRAAGKDDR